MNTETITFSLRWLGSWPWPAGLAAGVTLATAAWLLYRRDAIGGPSAMRLILPTLRALAVLLIVLMLSGPVIHHRKVIGSRTQLTILLDGSESMQLTDPALDAGRKIKVLTRLGHLEPGAAPDNPKTLKAIAAFDALPRWQRVQSLLLEGRPEQRLLDKLAHQFDTRLVWLEDHQLRQLWQPTTQDSAPPSTLPKPAGTSTDFTLALNSSVSTNQRSERDAILLISDGQQNSGDSPLAPAKLLGERQVPVFTLGIGSEIAPRDLALAQLTAPDSVFHEDRLHGEVEIKEAATTGQAYAVSIKDGDKVVWEKALVSESKDARKVPFEFPVKELAAARLKDQPTDVQTSGSVIELRVVISPIDGEAERTNNERTLRFRAVTQKQKVLIVDGRPRWEFRYLKNMFERDEKWEVNAVVAGATDDPGLVRGDKPGTFPISKERLDTYDLIILGEMPKALFKAVELEWLAEFVGKRGGATILIDSARGPFREYADTPLAPLIPVEYQADTTPLEAKTLTPSTRGATIAAFNLASDPTTNAQVWAKLPPPRTLAKVQPLPGAEVLIEAETAAGRGPAAVLRPFGAGRVYYHAFDDSWRWRYEVADEYHVRFWNQLAAHVAEPLFAVRDQFVALDAGKPVYQPDEKAAVRVRIRDGDGKPVTDATVDAVLTRNGKRTGTIRLTADAGGLFRGESAPLEIGDYEVAVECAAVPSAQLKARTQFQVTPAPSAERTLLHTNEPLLREIAQASGGTYLREEDADQLPTLLSPLSTGQVEEGDTLLWQSGWWFGAILTLLTTEWLLRKRVGML